MPLIVDGNNVMGRGNLSEAALISRLSQLTHARQLKIVAVFDGAREHGEPVKSLGKLEVRYAGKYSSADDAILAAIARIKDKHTWRLVSDDRELCTRAKALNFKTQSVSSLLTEFRTEQDKRNRVVQDQKPLQEHDQEGLLRAMMKNKG